MRTKWIESTPNVWDSSWWSDRYRCTMSWKKYIKLHKTAVLNTVLTVKKEPRKLSSTSSFQVARHVTATPRVRCARIRQVTLDHVLRISLNSSALSKTSCIYLRYVGFFRTYNRWSKCNPANQHVAGREEKEGKELAGEHADTTPTSSHPLLNDLVTSCTHTHTQYQSKHSSTTYQSLGVPSDLVPASPSKTWTNLTWNYLIWPAHSKHESCWPIWLIVI